MNFLNVIPRSQAKTTFIVFATVIIASCWLGAALDSFYPLAIPAFGLLIYMTIVDFKSVFFLLLACIPISAEFELPNGFSTDLPTEPLTIGLMLVYIVYALKKGNISLQGSWQLRGGGFLRHPITLLIGLHIGWIFVTMINSESLFYSIKYFLAKIWFVVTFYFLASLMLQTRRDFERFIWCIFTPLSIAIVITTYRHAAYDFSFTDINKIMYPMFRNHVSYGCILAVFLPYVILGRSWQRRFGMRWWLLTFAVILFLFAIQMSFTRAAYGAIIGAAGYYFIVKYRLTKVVIGLSIIGIISFVTFIVNDNKYLDYAPKFERAITHQSFDQLLEATAKGEDISTMERVYRWVAGFRMVSEKPFMGFGPNNFFNYYKTFTVTNFKTYVSDNKEGSTVHCYYLLTAIEQGILGVIIFFILIFYALIKAEQVYHRSEGYQKQVLMTTLLSFVILLILITINDLIETDKFGSFFFMSLAIFTNLDLATHKNNADLNSPKIATEEVS